MPAPLSRIVRRLVAPILYLFLLAPILPRIATADWGNGVMVSTQVAYQGGHTWVQLMRPTPTDVVVVWLHVSGTARWGAAQRLTDGGAVLWGPQGGGTNADGWAGQFPAIVDGTGGFFDAFSVVLGTDRDVYLENVHGDASHAPPTGFGWSVATTPAMEANPSIASDGAGGAFVAWLEGFNSSARLKHFQSDGSLTPGWPAAGLLLPPPTGYPINTPLPIDADGEGGAYVFWLSDAARVLRVTSGGTIATGWPSDGLVLASAFGGAGALPRIFPSGTGRIAVWEDQPNGSNSARVTLHRFLPDGTLDPAWPASGRVALDQSASIGLVRFVSDGLGGVTVLWEQSGLPRALHVLSSGAIAPGYPATGKTPLDAGAQYASNFAAATGRNGGVIFVWNDTRASRPGVRARWLQADGTNDPVEPDSGRVASPAGAVAATLREAIDDGHGGVYVAWQDGDPWIYGFLLRMNRLVSSALVDVGSSPSSHTALVLRAPAPNPASRTLSVRVALPSDVPARLELLDLAGRRVRAQDLAGAGERTASFDGLDRVAPGIYLLRLTQGRASRFARVAVMH